MARDWSAEGEEEREQCYTPILEALRATLPLGSRVLVPGAGLARLTSEIVGLGYKVEGNDFDLFMLFAADFMLNGCTTTVPIHPWVHSICNNLSHADATRTVMVPDTPVQHIIQRGGEAVIKHQDFAMCAGDFEGAYRSRVVSIVRECVIVCVVLLLLVSTCALTCQATGLCMRTPTCRA